MPSFFHLTQRRREPEVMDDPLINAQPHVQALRGLRRINRLSGSSRILWPAIRDLARELGGRKIRVLDIAAGGGDVSIAIARQATRMGLPIEVDACDVSSQALAYAREQAARKHAQLKFFELNALTDPIPAGYDVIMTSLFLHHLDDAPATEFLRKAAAATKHLLLVNDLRRNTRGLLLAYAGTRLLSRSKVVHTDGIISVRAAYTLPEVRELARSAGLDGAQVEPAWPCRFLLSWRRT